MNTESELITESAPKLSIGERLANARKAEGISLTKASNTTKLKVAYLEALEENNFEEIPAPIYAKNFIRIYGNYLGLDGKELSRDFGKTSEKKPPAPEPPKISFTYYVTLFLNAMARNIYLSVAVVACIILFFIVFKTPKEPEEIVAQNNNTPKDFIVELENYTPIYDLEEPLPNLK